MSKFKELVSETSLYNSYIRSAEKRGYSFELTIEQFLGITSKSCFYCGIEPSQEHIRRGKVYRYNGIDRVDNNIGYTFDNCVPCCHTCNYAKRSMSKDQFIQWVKRIYINQYRKVTDMTPGQLIDSLFTVDYKCWWAQEDIYKYKDVDPSKSAEAAYRAQELNAKRTKLIRTIDSVLDFSENTNTEKTYSTGDEKNGYTYFQEKT